ncbi:uncharacterized protein LOC125603337 [Brassica napus]|uniref:uncharacterized protein LOC125603337 n=1 Tax=Brassica napus TaxID=3708 RepID=UPI00207864E9|nr:uncharacterized protein LOC125603337 [Brassica napus]
MEGSNEVGSVSRMFSSFQPSENRAVESAVPQVALLRLLLFSVKTPPRSLLLLPIASDPKVWDAVMENKDLMNFLRPTLLQLRMKLTMTTNLNFLARLKVKKTVKRSQSSSWRFSRDMKLKAVQMMENVSSYFGVCSGQRLSQRVDRRGRGCCSTTLLLSLD